MARQLKIAPLEAAMLFADGREARWEIVSASTGKFLLKERGGTRSYEVKPEDTIEELDRLLEKVRILYPVHQRHEKRHQALSRTSAPLKVVAAMSLLVPKRIRDEEVGDAFEVLQALQRANAPRWMLWAKALTTVVWVFWHAVGFITSNLLGKAKKE